MVLSGSNWDANGGNFVYSTTDPQWIGKHIWLRVTVNDVDPGEILTIYFYGDGYLLNTVNHAVRGVEYLYNWWQIEQDYRTHYFSFRVYDHKGAWAASIQHSITVHFDGTWP